MLPGARITIDGLLSYITDVRGEVAIPELDTGAHSISIECPGYRPGLDRVELSSLTPTPIRTIMLIPEANPNVKIPMTNK